MNKTVNASVNGAASASKGDTQVIENKWRRVPESNRCTRICNPSDASESAAQNCKHPPSEGIQKSNGYGPTVNRKSGSRFGYLIAPALKRVCRMIGYSITTPDERSMWQLSAVLHARLQPKERTFLAVASLMALSDDEYQSVIDFMEGKA